MFRFILASAICLSVSLSAQAATLCITPQSPQPGDVLTVSLYPQAGETIRAVGMKAFDTAQLKFSLRPDGVARAFVGLPFDRSGGKTTLSARVQAERDGKMSEQIVSSVVTARARYFPTQRITMKGGMASKMHDKSALRKEKLLVQSKMKNTAPSPLWSGKWLIPTAGRSSSAYGRKRYVNGQWWGQHNGGDIKAPNGAKVVASNSGRVVLSQYLPALRGNCIVVDHGCNVFSVYMHLSKRIAGVGQSVQKGQLIGLVGATGFVTGPHLHWEIRIGWEPVDPFKFAQSGLSF